MSSASDAIYGGEPGARDRRGRGIVPGPGQNKNKIGWLAPSKPVINGAGRPGNGSNPVVHGLLKAVQAQGGLKKNGPTSGSVPMKVPVVHNMGAQPAKPVKAKPKGFSG